MPNERLRAAIAHAGITTIQLAQTLDVDLKTVQRWIRGRTPYPRHRILIAHTLNAEEHELWPEASPTPERHGEIIAVHPAGLESFNPDWAGLIDGAREWIDLLDFTLYYLLTTPGITQQLAHRAAAGCQIRILIGHPANLAVIRDQELIYGHDPLDPRAPEHHPHLAHKHQQTLRLLKPLSDTKNIHIRTHHTQRQTTIHRFDQQMLLTLHTWETPTTQAPTLHLQHQTPNGLFHHYTQHYNRIWNHTTRRLKTDPSTPP